MLSLDLGGNESTEILRKKRSWKVKGWRQDTGQEAVVTSELLDPGRGAGSGPRRAGREGERVEEGGKYVTTTGWGHRRV